MEDKISQKGMSLFSNIFIWFMKTRTFWLHSGCWKNLFIALLVHNYLGNLSKSALFNKTEAKQCSYTSYSVVIKIQTSTVNPTLSTHIEQGILGCFLCLYWKCTWQSLGVISLNRCLHNNGVSVDCFHSAILTKVKIG